MIRRYRLIEFEGDELYFSDGVQTGSMVLGVDSIVGDDGPRFRKGDVWGIDLKIRIGGQWLTCDAVEMNRLVRDWLDTPGNLQLLARRVEHAEERNPTSRHDRASARRWA